MATERYTGQIGRRKRKRKHISMRKLLVWIIDNSLRLATVALCSATIATVILRYIDPNTSGILSILPLGAPLIFALDIILLFYWIVRWKRCSIAIALVAVVIGVCYTRLYFQPSFIRNYNTTYVERKFLKLISYNISNNTSAVMIDSIAARRPDIVCIQEFFVGNDNNWDHLGSNYTSTFDGKSDYSCEIFVNSTKARYAQYPKYRIIRKGLIDSLPRTTAIWADVASASDTIRIINLHLQTTSIHNDDKEFIQQHEYLVDSTRDDRLLSIAHRLADNNRIRINQVRLIRKFIESSPLRTVVCGDLNDVPMSYTYRALSKDLTDVFYAVGDGYDYTFDGFFKLFRIDHLFVSAGIEPVSYEVDYQMDYSDHYPIISRLKISNNK